MSNGVKVSTIRYPNGEYKFVITMIIDDREDNWVEFDQKQIESLVAMFQERLAEAKEKNGG